MSEFAKTADKLEIKAGVIEGKVTSKEEVAAIASLPSRDGLLSMLLSVLQAPVRNVALAVKAVAEKRISCLIPYGMTVSKFYIGGFTQQTKIY